MAACDASHRSCCRRDKTEVFRISTYLTPQRLKPPLCESANRSAEALRHPKANRRAEHRRAKPGTGYAENEGGQECPTTLAASVHPDTPGSSSECGVRRPQINFFHTPAWAASRGLACERKSTSRNLIGPPRSYLAS